MILLLKETVVHGWLMLTFQKYRQPDGHPVEKLFFKSIQVQQGYIRSHQLARFVTWYGSVALSYNFKLILEAASEVLPSIETWARCPSVVPEAQPRTLLEGNARRFLCEVEPRTQLLIGLEFFSANERSKGEGKGKEEEGKGRGGKGERERRKGRKLEVKLWQKRKKSQTPQPGIEPGTPANAADALPMSHRDKRYHQPVCLKFYPFSLHFTT